MVYFFRDFLYAMSAIIMLTLIYMLASCEFVHARSYSTHRQARVASGLPRKAINASKIKFNGTTVISD